MQIRIQGRDLAAAFADGQLVISGDMAILSVDLINGLTLRHDLDELQQRALATAVSPKAVGVDAARTEQTGSSAAQAAEQASQQRRYIG